jgi:YD repeat-containing protein
MRLGPPGARAGDARPLRTRRPRQVRRGQPTSQSSDDHSTFYRYNALGEVIAVTDPSGNVIETWYDAGGRVGRREITTFSTIDTFDDRVRAIEYDYEARGMLSRVRQLDADQNVLDETALFYDFWGNLSGMVQDPDSELDAAGTMSLGGRESFTSQWSYAINSNPSARRNVYLQMFEQPGAGAFEAYFTGPINGVMGRPNGILTPNLAAVVYSYLGAGTAVGVEFEEAQVASRLYDSSGDYSDHLDRFNRPTTARWAKTSWATGGTEPVFVDLAMAYTKAGNPRYIQDNVLSASLANDPFVRSFDRLPAYDGMNRLTGMEEGELDLSGSVPLITSGTLSRAQLLARNLAGRVVQDQVDLDGNGIFTDGPLTAAESGEMDDSRSYNLRNELFWREVMDVVEPNAPGQTVELTYDRNGNLTSDGQRHRYRFDPWGRLVGIDDFATEAPIARYTYSGLNHRISEQTDTNSQGGGQGEAGEPDGVIDEHDSVFFIATDPQGRRVATYRRDDAHPKETFVYAPTGVAGLSGVFGGAALFRDRDPELSDPTKWELLEGPEERTQRHYFCSDHTGSVVALLGLRLGENEAPTATLAEQYRYSATGVPYGIPLGDIVADGVVTTADVDVVEDLSGSSGYQVRADLNLDGLVTPDDAAVAQPNLGLSTGRGYFGIITLRNRVGLGQLERTLQVGPGWSTGGGVYREDVNRHVGTEVVGGGGSGVNPRDIAPPGCAKVACPAGNCASWSCTVSTIDVPIANPPAPAPGGVFVPPPPAGTCAGIAAYWDAEIDALYKRFAVECPNVSIKFDCGTCGGVPGVAEPGWINMCGGPSSIRVCVNSRPGVNRVTTVKDTILHELTHALQACKTFGFPCDFNRREWNRDENIICQELQAYCTHRGNARFCEPNGSPKPGREHGLCQQACESVVAHPTNVVGVPTPEYNACVATCVGIAGQCQNGRFVPVGPVNPLLPF